MIIIPTLWCMIQLPNFSVRMKNIISRNILELHVNTHLVTKHPNGSGQSDFCLAKPCSGELGRHTKKKDLTCRAYQLSDNEEREG